MALLRRVLFRHKRQLGGWKAFRVMNAAHAMMGKLLAALYGKSDQRNKRREQHSSSERAAQQPSRATGNAAGRSAAAAAATAAAAAAAAASSASSARSAILGPAPSALWLLASAMTGLETALAAVPEKRRATASVDTLLPNRSFVDLVAARLATVEAVRNRCDDLCVRAGAHLEELIRLTFFMPFAVTSLAIIARVRAHVVGSFAADLRVATEAVAHLAPLCTVVRSRKRWARSTTRFARQISAGGGENDEQRQQPPGQPQEP